MPRRASPHFRRRPWWLVVLVVLMLLVIADRSGWLLVKDVDDMAAYHGARAPVTRVIDGDTIEVALPDASSGRPVTRVRLWGIDCPEMPRRGETAEPWAEEATIATSRFCDDTVVLLWLEPHRTRGTHGRVLAHVELPDGALLSERLLEAGLAVVDERWPHQHLTEYAQAQNVARREGAGLWAR